MDLAKVLKKEEIVILDGATGTNLLDKGLQPGEAPAVLNLKNPEAVYELQRTYITHGSDIILTNTFSANPINFKGEKYKEIIKQGVRIARRAAGSKKLILGDVGPLGLMLKPYGADEFEEAFKIYYEIFKTFYNMGVNAFFIETFNSFMEAKAAFLAGREFSDNLLVSFTFEGNYHTLFGDTPQSIAITFEKLGAKAIGVNCTEPETALEVLKRMSQVTSLPLIAKPNAGKVKIVGQKVVNSITDQELAEYFDGFIRVGCRLVGGCCGTSPRYIKILAHRKKALLSSEGFMKNYKANKQKVEFYLATPRRWTKIDAHSLLVVGERLNPSGRKKLKESLVKGDYTIYGAEAKAQEEGGADALDINAFVPELNEVETLTGCLYEVMKNSSLPLFLDTQNYLAAEKAMRTYPGIGVYNSIPARVKELKRFLPLAKKFGFKVVISLVGKKIPRSLKERLENAKRAISIARRLDFPLRDLIFDPLIFSFATNPEQIRETLRAVEVLNRKGFLTILGISNVSYGLPERSLLNAALLTLAVQAGVNFIIANPLDARVMEAYKAARTIIKGELDGYLKWAQNKPQQALNLTPQKAAGFKSKARISEVNEGLIKAIIEGDLEKAQVEAHMLLETGIPPKRLIDDYIFKAMKRVGEYYEQGVYFIPDLLKSAEATRTVLTLIKEHIARIPKKEKFGTKKRIVLATVKGDIHDIGKNIVAMVFESAGYEVIDLGKDVAAQKIVEAVKRYRPIAVGLSALLTTTMPEMGRVIKLLRSEGLNTPVIIGGPNVSPEFARQIGACAAVNNAFAGLEVLKQLD
ncbi:MAG: homocysteine S-methyltransferase family protein [candidate division WOR-3 bacterium]